MVIFGEVKRKERGVEVFEGGWKDGEEEVEGKE